MSTGWNIWLHEVPCRCATPEAIRQLVERSGTRCIDTLDLPRKNLTTDSEVIARAQQDGRIVVTKDADFVRSFLITGKPLLLLISTGNMSNTALEKILRANFADIEAAFATSRFVEITRDALVVHE